MKKINMVFFNIFKLTGLYILALGTLMGTIKANPINLPPLPTPAQFADRLKSSFESFIEVLKKDSELLNKGGSTLDNRRKELSKFGAKRKLNGGHIWLPFMNESDNTMVQVFVPPVPLVDAGFVVAQLFEQMMRYKIRPLTPLEFVELSKDVAVDIILLQSIINFIPEDRREARQILTTLVLVSEVGVVGVAGATLFLLALFSGAPLSLLLL